MPQERAEPRFAVFARFPSQSLVSGPLQGGSGGFTARRQPRSRRVPQLAILFLCLLGGDLRAADNLIDQNVYGTGNPVKPAILAAHENPDGTLTPIIRLDSNLSIGSVTLDATKGAGATDPNTLRVTLASDSPGVGGGGGSSGGLTDAQLRATAVPVSGTLAIANFPATQAVSGSVSISNFPATQPVSLTINTPDVTDRAARLLGHVTVDSAPTTAVTGTFWQTTQPVSGSLSITNFPATQPVAGTFWQATQPVSAAALPLPAGAATDATLTGGTQKAIARGGAKGTTAAADLTSVSVDANTQALHTNVTNFPATQPVSIASMPSTPVTGAFWQTTQPVSGSLSITNLPATQPVSGTFWQATQPVSAAALPLPAGAATDATLTGGTQKAIARGGAKGTTAAADLTSVSVDANTQALHTNVTNFPATQLVSGSVSVSNLPATQPVSGSVNVGNFPATQPVSLATNTPDVIDRAARLLGHVTVDSAPATAVTGTFWQATQPVSGSVSVSNLPATQPVSGTFFQATQPVSGPLTNTQLRATDVPVSGPLTDTQLRATAVPVSGTFFQATQPVSLATDTPDVTDRAARIIGKETKDAGRNLVTFISNGEIAPTATEALISLLGYKSGAAVTATTTPAVVTAGKTFRVTSINAAYRATATAGYAGINLRANTSGVAALTSPIVYSLRVGAASPSTAGAVGGNNIDFPDGLEFAAGTGIGVTLLGFSSTGTALAVGSTQISITGFEY